MTIAPLSLSAPPSDETLAGIDEPEEVARYTRWESGADGRRRGVSAFQLSGLHCAACAGVTGLSVVKPLAYRRVLTYRPTRSGWTRRS